MLQETGGGYRHRRRNAPPHVPPQGRRVPALPTGPAQRPRPHPRSDSSGCTVQWLLRLPFPPRPQWPQWHQHPRVQRPLPPNHICKAATAWLQQPGPCTCPRGSPKCPKQRRPSVVTAAPSAAEAGWAAPSPRPAVCAQSVVLSGLTFGASSSLFNISFRTTK